uniref:Uncharacterized protein n=1 Tax=Mycena chlorophos TaxID=658473 RepID=A0ABQ0LHF2_MYCCL|nr:predicted protein [Mycena chlorophos]
MTVFASPVPLGTGPPTREELEAHYPSQFTWDQLRAYIDSGDLGLLKRHKALQRRYDLWVATMKVEHGSMVNYLLNRRLQWGRPDTLCLLGPPFPLDPVDIVGATTPAAAFADLPPIPATLSPPYFSPTTPSEYLSIITNDWPYSVPSSVTHTLAWTRIPIFHPDLIDPSIQARIEQDGLWGFTGSSTPPPPLEDCLAALEDWGVTREKMIVSAKATPGEEELVKRAGAQVHAFVLAKWKPEEWETAWFVNPPRLQSVPGLAHVHIFAQRK